MAVRSRAPSTCGRQAEAARNDLAVLEAARDVFTAEGPDAPIAAVAARAGVGVGSLYRRYGTKTDLLQELCVLAMTQVIEAARTALAADDAWEGLTWYVRRCVELRSGALGFLAARIPTSPRMWAVAGEGVGLVDRLVDRTRTAGQLRPEVTATDLRWLIEQFARSGPSGVDPEEAQRVTARLLALALDGLRADGVDRVALPGPPPALDAYTCRWSAPVAENEST